MEQHGITLLHQAFSSNGAFLHSFGCGGNGVKKLFRLYTVCVCLVGNVYVTNGGYMSVFTRIISPHLVREKVALRTMPLVHR